ncbi:sorting nexin-13-like [Onthophagus taurus]|uniref:sorting nexin-13-like n=1 Tax=Onthophagus taurus TaxID=166361 RepID=UPI0039BDBFB8
MDTTAIGWAVLIFVLFLSTFGLCTCLTLIIGLIFFLIGLLSLLYIQEGDVDKFYRNCIGNPLSNENNIEGGLSKIAKQLLTPKEIQKADNRVTGSDVIDSSLQEILGYIIRDHITPWYGLISTDSEFSERSVRKTAQTLAINISNRVKEVDWIPFLTTRLVDDAASHLRLFKQARVKLKQDEIPKSPRNSPRREVRTPKKTHKRNKSETDANWHYVNKNSLDCKEVEQAHGNNKFYTKDQTRKNCSLEDYFFELEFTMEKNLVCRDSISINIDKEKEFLCELMEILLYILLPDDDFQCKPIRFIIREIFANCVVYPVFTMISDPDYINQAIVWLCLRDTSLPSDMFLTTLRITDNCDELKYAREIVQKEIQILRSRDSGGDSDLSIKQQLSSLYYVTKLIDNRLSKLANNQDTSQDLPLPLENIKTIDLPLHFILANSVALSYFIDFVSLQDKHLLLFFYLNIEGWKISVEQQLSNVHINKIKGVNDNSNAIFETIRATALSLYDQYLGDRKEQKLDINAGLVHKLYFKIKNVSEEPTELWFDDIQTQIYEKLKTEDDYLPSFKKSRSYIKLLEELELLQQPAEEDSVSLNSLEGLEDEKINQEQERKQTKLNNSGDVLLVQPEKSMKHVRSLSDVSDFALRNDRFENTPTPEESLKKNLEDDSMIQSVEEKSKDLRIGDFVLNVNIIETGIVCEKGKTFGIYAVHVSRQYTNGFLDEWHIYRRYSDFHDLCTKVKDKFPDLSKIPFPGKKTFHNMDRAVLERRMQMLGYYMKSLCQEYTVKSHHGLRELLMTFLEQGEYDRQASGGPISHTIDSIVNPLKSGMKSIKNMPEQIFNTMDEVVDSLNKVFHTKQGIKMQETSKVSSSLDTESDDNIPLRIMLLLMDEVFDLKSRNQWLRRRIVTLLRQIVRTMFGDIVNRRILDYVSLITSPKNVAHYLHVFKHSFWPNGMKAEKKPDRDESVKYRTRIAAKSALLSCLSDELKHIIGSETTRKGLLTIFELFQKPILNRRLLYVLLEDIICTLFPEKDIAAIFQKLYSQSKRYQEKQKDLNTQKNR